MDKIVGDGNCLFRAISKEVTMSEDQHHVFRAAAVTTLKDAQYAGLFQDYLGMDVKAYLQRRSKMTRTAVYGSEVEIIALSTWLSTWIAVYFKPSAASHGSWYIYKPITELVLDSEETKTPMLYIQNENEHFDRVLTVKSC